MLRALSAAANLAESYAYIALWFLIACSWIASDWYARSRQTAKTCLVHKAPFIVEIAPRTIWPDFCSS